MIEHPWHDPYREPSKGVVNAPNEVALTILSTHRTPHRRGVLITANVIRGVLEVGARIQLPTGSPVLAAIDFVWVDQYGKTTVGLLLNDGDTPASGPVTTMEHLALSAGCRDGDGGNIDEHSEQEQTAVPGTHRCNVGTCGHEPEQ